MGINLEDTTLEELNSLAIEIADEVNKRLILAEAGERIDKILSEVQQAQGHADGDPWEQPGGAYNAYPLGATSSHGGKLWENLMTANVWEPGTAGWREVVDPGAGPAGWLQPVGTVGMYQPGDRVTYQEFTWICTVANNVWAPGVYGWTKETP